MQIPKEISEDRPVNDPLMLVIKVPIGNLSPMKAKQMLKQWADHLNEMLAECNSKNILIPVKNGEPEITCINPSTVSTVQYKKIAEYLDYLAAGCNDLIEGKCVQTSPTITEYKDGFDH